MTVPHSAMVMAAGFGTRMGALTRDTPKPLLRAGTSTLLDQTLDHLAAAEVSKAVVNLHYLGDRIRTHLLPRTRPEIRFSDEQPEILDTGGGVVQALPLLGSDPFVTINSDAVFVGPNPVRLLAEAWQRIPADVSALMLFVARDDALAYTRPGDFFLPDTAVPPVRRGEADSAPFVYAGAQIIRPESFADTPAGPFSTNLVWNRLIAAGSLRAVVYPGKWVDVGTPEGLQVADAALSGAVS